MLYVSKKISAHKNVKKLQHNGEKNVLTSTRFTTSINITDNS